MKSKISRSWKRTALTISGLGTMNPDGSDVKQLTFFGFNGGSAGLGDWSPNGSELVFSQMRHI
jgi:Tol biopolymer transport system component